jgi:small subunit ribosomal protein S3
VGQKVHPVSFRLGGIKTWEGKWFGEKDFARNFHEDLKIRRYIEGKWKHAAISSVEVERAAQRVTVNIYTARPGIIIGRRGSEVDKLKDGLQKLTNKQIYINIQEIKQPSLEGQLVAENIALQLEKRINFRRAMRGAVSLAMRTGAKGIKVACAGRLGGREMARREWYKEGRIPLHTLRADIDYGFAEARTTYGKIGVKVWVFRGEVLDKKSAQGTRLPDGQGLPKA